MLSRDEILAIYAAGPEAVVQAIETLQTAQVQLLQQVGLLTARVAELEARLNKDSHNSSKPPSSDGLAKKPARTRSQRRRSGKKSGGQKGHPGAHLAWSDHPTHQEVFAPSACRACGTSLAEAKVVKCERRQRVDLPEPKLDITDYEAQHRECPACHAVTAGEFPADVPPGVSYGPRAKTAMVYLRTAQFLSAERTAETLGELFGLWASEGTQETAHSTAHTTLEPVVEALKTALKHQTGLTVDESGLRVAGRLHWIHVMGTDHLTYYAQHPKRGTKAIEAIGVLPGFKGWMMHDALPAYLKLEGRHALCNSHLLRELTAIHENTGQAWSSRLCRLLVRMHRAVAQAREAGLTSLPARQLAQYEALYTRLVHLGETANPMAPPSGKRGRTKQTPARNLLNRLITQRQAVLAFLYDFDVPFDNNRAERDLRMVKVKLKVSGCFRSPEGADMFCRIRSYIATLRKQGYSVFDGLVSVFTGQPYMPRLTA